MRLVVQQVRLIRLLGASRSRATRPRPRHSRVECGHNGPIIQTANFLFGIQYWNTGEPASGTPAGRSSTDLDVKPPDPLFVCCAWGFTGGTEKNNPYAGWYHAATTVRLAVKDKALMDQIIKASQELVAMEVSLDGRTITGFKVIKGD